MRAGLFVRAPGLVLGLLAIPSVSYSQPSPNETASPPPPQIIYTGKLLGYFRLPSLQPRKGLSGCRQVTKGVASDEAKELFTKRVNNGEAILIGTGDNFAPQLEARTFEAPKGSYEDGNKELYFGNKNDWIFYKEIDKYPETKKRLARGEGTIPTDNVGCFLATAGYAAVVPGKHDFYFGAERVRQLARFMSGLSRTDLPKDFNLPNYNPPQMLGANLVIKTEPVEPTSVAKQRTDLWFGTDKPSDFSILNPQDGKIVYPWFSYVQVKILDLDAKGKFLPKLIQWISKEGGYATEDALKQFAGSNQSLISADELSKLSNSLNQFPRDNFHICDSKSAPDELDRARCVPLKSARIRVVDKSLVYDLALPQREYGNNFHFSTLTRGKNYGVCRIEKLKSSDKPKNSEASKPNKSENAYCVRFSVYTPFFVFPNSVTSKKEGYTDPDPFVFLPASGTRSFDVAIFGVVDPNLAEHVGSLNFSWLNQHSGLTTVVSAEDPAEALREQFDYFHLWYSRRSSSLDAKRSEPGKSARFSGVKILLAQMSPQRSRVLAARLPEFQVVVAAADEEQATSAITQSITWTPEIRASALVAVPRPPFDSEKGRAVPDLAGIHFSRDGANWKLQSVRAGLAPVDGSNARIVKTGDESDLFETRLKERFPDCLSKDEKGGSKVDRLKLFTLCAMRQRTGADVALIQKRDFFEKPLDNAVNNPNEFQRLLDRVIWKGDLLTLLYVPGSALKQTLAQSRKYDAEDANLLTLTDEWNRGLEYIGIRKVGGEYLINEVPIEDKKIYSVATTDYIGAGDTGYPGLSTAALNPKRRPSEFPEKLEPISSVVCRKLFSHNGSKPPCLPKLDRNAYLDESQATPVIAPPKPGVASMLWDLLPFRWPAATPKPKTSAAAVEQKVQQRPIWIFSLKNFSVGFNGLTKNLTDAEIAAKFSGIPTPGVTARKNSSITAQMNTQLSRTSHANEFFFAFGADYKQTSTGDVLPAIVQSNNRATADVGLIRSIRGGRSQTRVGLALYLHTEAPLQKPFATFTLSTQDRLRISQDRNYSILPRVGLRWQHRLNSFEAGMQAGREINAFGGYRFETQGTIVECLPNSTETFAACITRLSKLPSPSITKDSIATAILDNRPRAGLYSRITLSVPFGPKVKYVFSEEGDLFFNFHGDTAIDTRFRDISTHSLKFVVWPSLSIGPTMRLLLYQNKVNGDFLFQKQFGFETSLSFDLFNRREKMVQIKHKPVTPR